MPFYRSLLGNSALPLNEKLNLKKLSSDENYNAHFLSLAKLVSRLSRELSCEWIVKNIPSDSISTTWAPKAYSQEKVKTLVLESFSLVLEMIVAAEFAREDLHSLFVIKHALIKTMPLLQLLRSPGDLDQAHNLNGMIWEIHNLVCARSNPNLSRTCDSPGVLLLWGESALKLARTYFSPTASSEFTKTEYFDCLSLASRKFNQALACVKRNGTHQSTADSMYGVGAFSGLGYVNLLKGRASRDQSAKQQFLIESKRLFTCAEELAPSTNSTYNLACVCSLLGRPADAHYFLDIARSERTLPSKAYISRDPDLQPLMQLDWFRTLFSTLEEEPTLNSLDRSVFHRAPSIHNKPPSLAQPISSPNTQTEKPVSSKVMKYTDDDELNTAITYDEDLNKLQASLLRDGFSVNTVAGMVLEVGTEKHKKMEADKVVIENRNRLNERLVPLGLAPKRVIPGDGNCQFCAISDQLFDTLDNGGYVRQKCVDWLRENRDWELPNGAVLWNFAHDQSWEDFCMELSRSGIWGNHLTLVAACETFGVRIRVISSVKGDSYITSVNPKSVTTQKIVWLSHYAEFHYGSLKML
eukprot:TRINITY_DN7059_c0_g1_i1.p1 TRINITY_DN7059_c0_g1~~TRINITY_DN7059_c0_g1_i1.p1  ORF type:complete len:582 (-),score=102.00 TRINITY_DN7059_c0_g1_i1:27-1772(-)